MLACERGHLALGLAFWIFGSGMHIFALLDLGYPLGFWALGLDLAHGAHLGRQRFWDRGRQGKALMTFTHHGGIRAQLSSHQRMGRQGMDIRVFLHRQYR